MNIAKTCWIPSVVAASALALCLSPAARAEAKADKAGDRIVMQKPAHSHTPTTIKEKLLMVGSLNQVTGWPPNPTMIAFKTPICAPPPVSIS